MQECSAASTWTGTLMSRMLTLGKRPGKREDKDNL
jgi:hypothetical protein